MNANAFENNLVVGEDRVGDVKFYQYHRDEEQQSTQYYDPVWINDDPTQYFDTNE